MPPKRLRYQNARGTTERFTASDAIHCTRNREPNITWPVSPIADQRTGFNHHLLMGHLTDLIVEQPRAQPEHSDEIVDPAREPVPDAVFGHAAHARPMIHEDLGHARAAELAERGEEAVHAHEHREPFERGAAIDLERAPDVGERVAEHPPANRVRDARGSAAEPAVLALPSNSGDDVRVAELLEKERDVGGIVLAVRVERDHDLAAHELEPRDERRALPRLAREVHADDAGARERRLADPGAAFVLAPVVDQDDLVREAGRAERALELVDVL